MELNDYEGVVEAWKTDLIVSRAILRGISEDDLPDVLQQIIPDVAAFKYDPENAKGAKESTALTEVIDHRLHHIQRSTTRYKKHYEKYAQLEPRNRTHDPNLPLEVDVRSLLNQLTPKEQDICRMLAAGHSTAEIAEELKCGWRAADNAITHIRHQFEALGLDEWVRKARRD